MKKLIFSPNPRICESPVTSLFQIITSPSKLSIKVDNPENRGEGEITDPVNPIVPEVLITFPI